MQPQTNDLGIGAARKKQGQHPHIMEALFYSLSAAARVCVHVLECVCLPEVGAWGHMCLAILHGDPCPSATHITGLR